MARSRRDGRRTRPEEFPKVQREIYLLNHARRLMIEVREALKKAEAPQTLTKARSLLKSLDGAIRYRKGLESHLRGLQ